MKKLISSILILIITLSFFGCKKNPYPPVKSTTEEARTVMTLQLDGEKYEIKYELYRALFLTNKSSVDGGNSSVWSGNDKDTYIKKIEEIIISEAAKIYSVIHLSDKLGLKPYSKEINEQVTEYIRISIEGNNADVIGYGGDYDKYLASLKNRYLNYSVQELLIRYSVMLEKLREYYFGYEDEALGQINGDFNFSEENVREFYFSNDCARVLHAYMRADTLVNTLEKMQSIRQQMLSCNDDIAVALCIINNTFMTPTDLIQNKAVTGIIVGRQTVDSDHTPYINAAFSLNAGEVSEVVEVGGSENGYYLIYGLEKNEEHFKRCYEDIKEAYLDNAINSELISIAERLASSASRTSGYKKINHTGISM